MAIKPSQIISAGFFIRVYTESAVFCFVFYYLLVSETRKQGGSMLGLGSTIMLYIVQKMAAQLTQGLQRSESLKRLDS